MRPGKNRGRKRTIQPISITRFWHRRIAEAAAFVALAILLLYGLTFAPNSAILGAVIQIPVLSAGLAVATLVAAIIAYFIHPQKNVSRFTFAVYVLLTVTIASLVVNTGEVNSPLISAWIATSVFAGVFGWPGFIFIVGLLLGFDAYAFTSGASPSTIIAASISTVAPLIVSYIIWHSKSDKDIKQDKAYRDLASELSHEANKSETVINAINDGVIAVDKDGVIQLINPAAQRIVGWSQNDALGLSYESVVKLRDKTDKQVTPETNPIAQVLLTNKQVHSDDLLVATEAGKKLLLSLVVSPLGQPGNGAIMVFRDITKEKADEREQAEFISTASHEMRTPVASIEGYLGLALNPATATIDDKAREYIQKAQASAQHLGRLFQDLLDVTKADDGRLNNNPSVVDTAAFVSDIAEGLRPKALEKGLRFVYKPTVDDAAAGDRKLMPVYYVNVDKDHLREVTSNLIENAIKYTPAGDITVNVTGDDTHVTVSVKDSGIGIPPEDIPHLFQKFYRVDNSDTREIGGTGLGLYLCRRLAEVMGGRMAVESAYKKGSTFSLVLPRVDHKEVAKLQASARSTPVAPAPIVDIQPPLPPQAPPTPTIQQSSAAVVPPAIEQVQPVQTAPPNSVVQTAPAVINQQPAPAPQPQPTDRSAPLARPGQDIIPSRPAPQAPVNIPLTQLEQNPTLYTSRSGVPVPNRTTNQ